ncbi:MAG: mannose-1-phosphate guanylyltransferase [Verrucomicrobia bacterium]|nr:mannose-1-phosphate guanylyltransferase [Cytophagales bacterium]
MNYLNNYVVIMAGGIGTRFWPFSRTDYPKQFHDVLGTGKTLLQQTAERFEGICPKENIYVVTSTEYKDLVTLQLPFLDENQILLEPSRRNTAPCVAYAAYKIAARNPEANLVVAPADHIILKEDVFRERVTVALNASAEGEIIVTLGIHPSRPDTGYGYIQFDEKNKNGIHKVKVFTEKPELEWAIKFLESGEYVWNAGIFIWNVQTIMKNFQQFQPEMDEIFADGQAFYYTAKESDYISKAYTQCKNISIDFAVMEKAKEVFVVLSDFGWSDLGTWKSLYEVSPKDHSNNVIDGNVILYDTKDCIVKTPSHRLVAINGLKGFIVAEYDNVLLICKKEDEQKVKDLVADAKNKGNEFV